MAEQKSFFKKYEFLIVAAATLLVIYIISILNQNVGFFLGNDLIVNLEPQQKSLEMNYGNSSGVEFDASIDNVFYCRAACSYSFNDRSRDVIIESGNFEIKNKQHFARSYEISVKRLGSGQDVYSFDVRCRSVRSFFCLTKSPERLKSSLVTVNYDLTEAEKELKNQLKQNVTQLLGILAEEDEMHQKLSQKYFELGRKISLSNLSSQKTSIDDASDRIRIAIENLRSIWSVEDYIKLNRMFNSGFLETLEGIKNSILDLDSGINGIADLHNKLLLKLDGLSARLAGLSSFAAALGDKESNQNFNGLISEIKKFNGLSSSMINNTFVSYENISKELENLSLNEKLLAEKTEPYATGLFLKSEYAVDYENSYLCSLRKDCKENISASMTASEMAKNAEVFVNGYPNASPLKKNCDLLGGLLEKYARIRNETISIMLQNNISFPQESSFTALADNFSANEIRKINNSYYDSLQAIIGENKTASEIINALALILPENKTEIAPLDYNESINLSLYLLSQINPSNNTLNIINKCNKLGNQNEIGILNSDFVLVSKNITYRITSKIDTNLSDNPPICCVFRECSPCCRDNSCINDPKTFPVIFLHGHSFSKGNSPEFSLDSFNQIQLRLQEDGYLNAGIISLYSKNESEQDGIWGLSGKPVSVKVSYYYDAFSKEGKYIIVPTKSESIDTYALRLKDLIDIVKKRTGKPKVNIVAYSMGGLVARRYIQIFGEEHVDKLVTISTPNKGITGSINNYCGLIGEDNECRDMQENSLFINRLNDPLKQPSKVLLYSIIGRGCSGDLGDGDGVVLSESAKLENAKPYFVNGTCSKLFGETLHTEMLNIEKYNETYRILKEILKE